MKLEGMMFQSNFPGGHGIGPQEAQPTNAYAGFSKGIPFLLLASILAAIVLAGCSSKTADLSKEELATCFSYCLGSEKNETMDVALKSMGRVIGLGHMCKEAELVIKIGEDAEAQIVPIEKFSVGYGVDGPKYKARVCEVYVPWTKASGYISRYKCGCDGDEPSHAGDEDSQGPLESLSPEGLET